MPKLLPFKKIPDGTLFQFDYWKNRHIMYAKKVGAGYMFEGKYFGCSVQEMSQLCECIPHKNKK